jgi:hypothetical protein
MSSIDVNVVLEGATAFSAVSGLLLYLFDRFVQACIPTKLETTSLPAGRDTFSGLVDHQVPAIASKFKNHGLRTAYICDVYLLVNKKEIIRPYPHLFYEMRGEAQIESGRARKAVFYGQEILNLLPAHVGEKFSLQVVFVSENDRLFKGRRMGLHRSALRDQQSTR